MIGADGRLILTYWYDNLHLKNPILFPQVQINNIFFLFKKKEVTYQPLFFVLKTRNYIIKFGLDNHFVLQIITNGSTRLQNSIYRVFLIEI